MRLRFRTLFRAAGIFLLVVVVLVAAAWLLRVPLFGGLVKSTITGELAEALGGAYEIDDLGGNWVTEMEVRGLRTVRAPESGAVERVGFEKAVLRYDVLGLLRGDGLRAVERVDVRGGEVRLDLDRPADPKAEKGGAFELPEDVRTRVHLATDVTLKTADGPVRVTDLRLAWGPGEPLSLDAADLSLPDRFEVHGPLAGKIERVDEERYRWTSNAELGGVRVPQAVFTTTGDVTGTIEVAGARVQVDVDSSRVRASAKGVDLARLPGWMSTFLPEDVPLPSAGRVDADLDLPWRDAPAEASLRATDLAWKDQEIREIEAVLRWARGGPFEVLRADVRGDDVFLHVVDAAVDTTLPFYLRSVREFDVEVASVKAFRPGLPRDASLVLRGASENGRDVRILRGVVASRGDRLELKGGIRLPGDPELWKDASLDLAITGRVADFRPFHDRAELDIEGGVEIQGRVSGAVLEPAFDLAVAGAELRVEGVRVDGLVARGRLQEDAVELEILRASGPAGTIAAAGRLDLDPFAAELRAVTADLVDLPLLASFLEAAPLPLQGRLRVDGRLRYAGELELAAGQVRGTNLAGDGLEVGDVDADVRLEHGLVVVERLDASGPWGRAHAQGTADFEARTGDVDHVRIETEDVDIALRAPARLRWTDGVIRVEGLDADVDDGRVLADVEVQFEEDRATLSRLAYSSGDTTLRLGEPLSVSWSDDLLRVPRLAVVVDGEDLALRTSFVADLERETLVISTLEATGSFGEVRLTSPLKVVRKDGTIDVHDLHVAMGDLELSASGSVRPEDRRAVLDVLRVVAGADVDVRSNAPVAATWDETGVSIPSLDVQTLGMRIAGRAAWKNGPEVDLAYEGLRLDRWTEAPTGVARGRLQWRGKALEATLEIPALAYESWVGKASLVVRQDEDGPLRLESLRIVGPRGGTVSGEAVLPYHLGERGVAVLEDVQPTFALEGVLGGLDALTDAVDGPLRLRARGDADGISLRLQVADLGLCNEDSLCDDVVLEARIGKDEVTLRSSLLSEEFARVGGRFRVDRGFDWTQPGTAQAFLDEGRVEGSLELLVRDWKPLAAVAPGLRHVEGAVAAALRVRGSLRKPDVDGVLTLQDFGLGLDTDVAPFQKVNARLVWKGDTVHIERLEAEMGYAPVSMKGTVKVFFDALPELDIEIHGRNTQLLRTDWTRMRINVDGRIAGRLDKLKATGTGEIVQGLFREPVSLGGAGELGEAPEVILFDIPEWPFSEMEFDLRIKADESIRIRNNLLRVNVSFDGALKGTGLRPEVHGRAWFRNADIFLPLTTLRRGEGEIEFLPSTPFRPRIQMTAQTRTRGYEVGVQLAGIMPDVNLYVFTEPWLDDEDAMLMLTTGSTSAELAQGGIVGKALSGILSIFGGSIISSNSDTGEPGDLAFFERFQFTADWEGVGMPRLDGEIELTDRYFLRLGTDRFEATNLGFIWRIRFR